MGLKVQACAGIHSLHTSASEKLMNQKLSSQVWSPVLHGRTPVVEVEGVRKQVAGVAFGSMGTWGEHETHRGDREPRGSRPPRDPPDVRGSGGRRAGEKEPVRGSCCDSEKRWSCEQPRRPVPLTGRRFRKWHAKSLGLE